MKNDQDDLHRTTLRLPSSLYKEIEKAANYNGRSVNAEIVARLQTAALDGQFSKIFRELAEIKASGREILDAVTDRRK